MLSSRWARRFVPLVQSWKTRESALKSYLTALRSDRHLRNLEWTWRLWLSLNPT